MAGDRDIINVVGAADTTVYMDWNYGRYRFPAGASESSVVNAFEASKLLQQTVRASAEKGFQMGIRRNVSLRSIAEERAPGRPNYLEASFGRCSRHCREQLS